MVWYTVGDHCLLLFDRTIVPELVGIDPNCKGNYLNFLSLFAFEHCIAITVLRKNFTQLCHCLPQSYEQTIDRLKKTKIIPEGMMHKLSVSPNFELANATILGGLIRPLRQEVEMLEFCDTVEDLIDDVESIRFINKLRDGKIMCDCH